MEGSVEPCHLSLLVDPCGGAAIGPAHVAHAHEIAGGQPAEVADLDAEHCGLAAEPHRADAELVGLGEDLLLHLVELGNRVAVVETPQQLALGLDEPRAPVTAEASADDSGRAALALRLR